MSHRVIQKPLHEDCLLDGELHPSIRLRLERIRELPMTGVANLHGVERVNGQAMLIWEFADGRTLQEVLADADEDVRDKLKRDVILLAQQLHGFGIVHGALHDRNIIVDDRGRMRLTHLSPLLHNDEAEDINAIERTFVVATPASRSTRSVEIDHGAVPHRDAGSPLASREPVTPEEDGHSIRIRAIAGTVVAILIGVGVATSIIWYSQTHP